MRWLDFSVELWRSAFDKCVADYKIFNMPVKFCLEFVSIVGPNFSEPEWELSNDVVYKINGVGLRIFVIDFEGSNTSRIVDGRVLKAPYFLASFAGEDQKFYFPSILMPGRSISMLDF